MGTFRAYLKAQCEDLEFRIKYHEQCGICQRTAMLISTIQQRGLSNEEVAHGAGVELDHLELLESADRCFSDDILKLSHFLGIQDAGECRKGHK